MRFGPARCYAAVLLASLIGAPVGMAQTFPEEGRTITLMVPYAAGGTVDGTARLMAAGLEEELGTAVQVVNKPGAASQGVDVVTYSATGMIGPAGMPEEVVKALSEAMEKVIASDAHQERLTQYGVTSRYLGPDAYDAFWADYEGRIGPVIEAVRAN
jgi:tripartite-type tricarboxylate transporter receptor subunit TctC